MLLHNLAYTNHALSAIAVGGKQTTAKMLPRIYNMDKIIMFREI